MKTISEYSSEVRESAVRLVIDQRAEYASEWATIQSRPFLPASITPLL